MRRLLFAIPILALNMSALSAEQPTPKPFPKQGLLPKTETGALRLLEQHPEYDGRGVTVAIFDTGVDPAAAGMQLTTTGQPKIVDMIDGTGSGDVAMNTTTKAKEQQLTGATGRTLTLSADWKNPSGKFHLGMKPGYDLFPGGVVSRLKRTRKREFELKHRKLVQRAEAELKQWQQDHPAPKGNEKKTLAEWKARVAQLAAAWKRYDDPGPIYDCVTFHDGTRWQAVIDTDADGNLAEEKVLTNYRVAQQFATFGNTAHVNFSVNIYDDGKVLSLVTDSGYHGTHVAGIVAAHFPEAPERNGVAPGAQIISVKIGDTRIGGMETGPGLIRGLTAVLENNCDLINMSYGEPTSAPDQGRLISLFDEIVNKHGVIFVASAGNAGPALTTVGAPGGTSSAILGIGAYVSPAMMSAQYAMPADQQGMPYSWSSRGPTADGDLGVNLFAPGGAIAPVPTSNLQSSRQANGTSMSSPNACGNIALLLSGLKQHKISYSPWSIRRVLENTAKPLADIEPFAQGAGLIQIDTAFEYASKQNTFTDQLRRLKVEVQSASHRRGIYLREPWQTEKKRQRFSVNVRPVFPESLTEEEQIRFEMKLSLQSSAEWVKTSDFLFLHSGGANCRVGLDLSTLEPGVHFAWVTGHDAAHPNRGPLFRLPVTVTIPTLSEHRKPEELAFTAGTTHRRFLDVPDHATWMTLKLTAAETNAISRFVLHQVQLRPGHSPEAYNQRQYLTLQPGETFVKSVPVKAGRTLELCLAQYWSSLAENIVKWEWEFHGIVPGDSQIELDVNAPATPVYLQNHLHPERLNPQALLTHVRRTLAPSSAKVQRLSGERDTLINGQCSAELLLTYDLELKSDSHVTIRFPRNDDLLYDSPFGTQLWMLFDANRRLVRTDDVYPGNIDLKAGKYRLQLQLKHTNRTKLEATKTACVQLDLRLAKPVALKIHATRQAALTGGSTFRSGLFPIGAERTLWIAHPAPSSSLLTEHAGDLLLGNITYGEERSVVSGVGRKPGGYPMTFAVPALHRTPKVSPTPKSIADQQTLQRQLQEFQCSQLQQIAPQQDALFEQLAGQLELQDSLRLKVAVARLHRYDTTRRRKDHLPKVIKLADAVMALIDQETIRVHQSTRPDVENATEVTARKVSTEQKAILIDTLYRKGRAIGYQELPDVIEKHPVDDPAAVQKAFEENYAELSRWVDPGEQTYHLLKVRRERRMKRYATAVQILNQHRPATPDYWHSKKRGDLAELLEWDIWADYERTWMLRNFPKTDRPF